MQLSDPFGEIFGGVLGEACSLRITSTTTLAKGAMLGVVEGAIVENLRSPAGRMRERMNMNPGFRSLPLFLNGYWSTIPSVQVVMF